MRELTVAVVQMAVKFNDVEANLVAISEWIHRIATEQKVDLIVFPELCTTGYECGVRFTDFAQRVPGPSSNLIAQRASDFGVHVAFGMAAKEKVESIIYNSAVLVGPDGDLVGDYRKVHLKGEERLAFRSGFKFPLIETDFGNVGLMVGWDLAFPEVARTYVLDGADLLIECGNWEKPNDEEWRTYLDVARLRKHLLHHRGQSHRHGCHVELLRSVDDRRAARPDLCVGRRRDRRVCRSQDRSR